MGTAVTLADATSIARSWTAQFADAASSGNVYATTNLFLCTGWLRDNLVFTWTHRSLCGHDAISGYLTNRMGEAKITNVKIDDKHGIAPNFFPGQPMVEAALTFETPIAYGRGLIRLLPDQDGRWKALTVFLMLDDLKGHEEKGFESGYYEGHTRTWDEVREEERTRVENDPHVVIIGAGQSGLNVGARFRQMNIPALLIDQTDAVGDVWRMRYPTLTLHTPNTHHALLYSRFPTNAPKFTARDRVASMLEQYAHNQNLVVWSRTTVLPTPSYDHATNRWTVTVLRDGFKKVTLHPHHIILAMGTLGKPYVPSLLGMENFKGEAHHATDFKGAWPWTGKKTVVVGASQTAADICQDLVSRGAASVTMVQRSSTIVVASKYVNAQLDSFWPMHSDSLVGDFRVAGMPLGLLKQIHISERESRVAQQREMIEGLLKAGLNINEGEEGAGQLLQFYQRLGGYWQDIGTANLIIEGKVKVKQGTEPDHFTPNGLVFKDGSSLEADLVVFATGYEPIANTLRGIFGEEVAAKTTPVWGLDREGESRRAFTPSGHPGASITKTIKPKSTLKAIVSQLWWAIGDFMYSRFYSKSLAIQIKARELGLVKY